MRHVRRSAIYPLIAALAGVVMLVRAGSTIAVFNDTYDEPFHIAAATTLMELGRLVDGIETPPVARIVQGLALRVGGVQTTAIATSRTIHDAKTSFKIGDDLLLRGRVPYWRTLAIARGATLFFGAVVLVYVYLFGRWAGGPVVGMFATIFCSTDPTLLAHTALATSDAAAAAGFVAGSYHALRWIFFPDPLRALFAGAALGVAIGAKFSCLALLPIIVLLIVWRLWFIRPSERAARLGRRLFGGLLIIALVAFVSLWACYFFDVGSLAESEMVSFGRWRLFNTRMARIPIPMPSLPLGLLILQRHNHSEHAAYLMGAVRDGGWWYYFPLALMFKSPLAVVAGVGVATGLAIYRARRRRITIAIATPIVMLMLIAMNSSIQIGVRYLLPLIPLIYVLVSWQLCRRRWVILLMALIGLAFVETAARHPDYLSFLNVAARAASRERPVLLDSNVDWGQDVARLDRWLRAEYPNTPYETRILCSVPAQSIPGSAVKINQLLNLRSGLLIVDKNVRYGLYNLDDPRSKAQARMLKLPDFVYTNRPIAQIGDTLEVYEITGPTVKD